APRLAGDALAVDGALRRQAPVGLAWALFTAGVAWLGGRVPPFGERRWPLGVAVNLVSSMAVVVGLGVFYIVNARAVQGVSPDAQPLMRAALRSFVFWFSSDGLLYWAILAIDYGVRDYRESRERALRGAQLETQLSEARLHALTMQLQPHFLFNALHTIGQLIRTAQPAPA